MVTDPLKIKYYLKKAVAIAKHGRKGPVLLDLPEDVTWSEIPDEIELQDWIESFPLQVVTKEEIQECVKLIQQASEPADYFWWWS